MFLDMGGHLSPRIFQVITWWGSGKPSSFHKFLLSGRVPILVYIDPHGVSLSGVSIKIVHGPVPVYIYLCLCGIFVVYCQKIRRDVLSEPLIILIVFTLTNLDMFCDRGELEKQR